jgi:hypothetical protein
MFYPFETVKPVLEEVNPFCLTRGKEQGSVEPGPLASYLDSATRRSLGNPRFSELDCSRLDFIAEYTQTTCVLVSKSSAETKNYSNLLDFTGFSNKRERLMVEKMCPFLSLKHPSFR